MKLLTLVQAVALTGSFVVSTYPAFAEEDCCAGVSACEAMHKAKSKSKAKTEEVQKVSSEKTVETKEEVKPVDSSTEKPEKSI